MKVCIIQPEYSTDYERSEELFEKELDLLHSCDSSMDMIVLPESCDIPALAKGKAQRDSSEQRFNQRILDEASATAKRCSALVFINARSYHATGTRNTTYVFDRSGGLAGQYHKQHPTPGEVDKKKLDSGYTFEHSQPDVIEIEGIRFGFLICYDAYFYENFSNMARQDLDVIVACSHQRSDTHRALQIMTQFLAYNTNTYVVRSSVSMDVDSDVGGASMVVAPDGEILCHMGSRIGLETVEVDVHKKYYKPAGFGNPPAAHYAYIEQGRRPWKYRPAGSAIVLPDSRMPYPRICAHRGFNTIAPENSMPAYGAAVAMGAQEIEFDLWWTSDGEIVSIHDAVLDRVSTGTGKVYKHTYAELMELDFGVKYSEKFKGLKILTFEQILQKFACHVVMNIHIKTRHNQEALPESFLKKIVDLIHKYDCKDYVYFMTGNDVLMEQLRTLAPHITRCMGGGDDKWGIVERAIRYDCKKVQLVKGYFNQTMIDRAHENGIVCNVFWADEPEEAQKFLNMGIDVILTNNYNEISQLI